MTEWLCPECGGGFPQEQLNAQNHAIKMRCPWCGNTLSVHAR